MLLCSGYRFGSCANEHLGPVYGSRLSNLPVHLATIHDNNSWSHPDCLWLRSTSIYSATQRWTRRSTRRCALASCMTSTLSGLLSRVRMSTEMTEGDTMLAVCWYGKEKVEVRYHLCITRATRFSLCTSIVGPQPLFRRGYNTAIAGQASAQAKDSAPGDHHLPL